MKRRYVKQITFCMNVKRSRTRVRKHLKITLTQLIPKMFHLRMSHNKRHCEIVVNHYEQTKEYYANVRAFVIAIILVWTEYRKKEAYLGTF